VDWNEEATRRLYAEIGTRIRRARKQHGWNQVDLARAVDLTRSSIANIEAGRQRALTHVVVLIAQALSVPVETLLPSAHDLDKIAAIQPPSIGELEGQSETTHDFVTTALRRVAGG
jgi:transcriptional regulator with XRE-family HTH domain